MTDPTKPKRRGNPPASRFYSMPDMERARPGKRLTMSPREWRALDLLAALPEHLGYDGKPNKSGAAGKLFLAECERRGIDVPGDPEEESTET